MLDPPIGRPVVAATPDAEQQRWHQCGSYIPGPVAIGRPVLPLPATRSPGRLQPRTPGNDESPPPSERPFDPWMWVWGPLLLVPLIILFASEVESWPAVDTATETPWLPPSLCALDDTRTYVSYLPPAARRKVHSPAGTDVPSVQRADQEPAGTVRASNGACPSGVNGPSTLSLAMPAGMQGWPALGSNVSLVVYHGEDRTVTLGSLTLRDASGGVLLDQPTPTTLPAETAHRLDARRPGRELKGGGGGGRHGRRGGHGGYTTSIHRPSTALPRYSSAGTTRTAYGMHARRAVATGTAVAILIHPGYSRTPSFPPPVCTLISHETVVVRHAGCLPRSCPPHAPGRSRSLPPRSRLDQTRHR